LTVTPCVDSSFQIGGMIGAWVRVCGWHGVSLLFRLACSGSGERRRWNVVFYDRWALLGFLAFGFFVLFSFWSFFSLLI
jgi:hypothetical protein